MHDIGSREDIVKLVKAFYEKAVKDEVIGHFFTEVLELDLQKHLPLIYDFWEGILLPGQSPFRGNPMPKHLALNKKSPMRPEHFERWLALWNGALQEMFDGPISEEASRRAKLMADLMQFKIEQSKNSGFIQ